MASPSSILALLDSMASAITLWHISSEPSLKVGDVLSSGSCQYCVLEIMGSGVFGQVARCLNAATREMVAVKLFRSPKAISEAQLEVFFLRKVRYIGHPNLVRFIEVFSYQGYPCLVLEILHKDLFQTVKNQEWKMQLNKIRPIAKQLLLAINSLSEAGIVHSDIKPDNVMFVSRERRQVKLIDFGLALLTSRLKPGMLVQAPAFRAPEVLLGLPFDHRIDVWGIGCVFAFLYLSGNLFRARCGYEQMRQVVHLLGQPDDRLLRQGKHTRKYFLEEEGADGPTWRLKTLREYVSGVHDNAEKNVRDCSYRSLDDLVNVYPLTSPAEQRDRREFVDLLKCLLNVDSEQRVSSSQALQHPFITMAHLSHPSYQTYLADAREMMRFCCEDGPSSTEDGKPETPASKDRAGEHLELKETALKEVEQLQTIKSPATAECKLSQKKPPKTMNIWQRFSFLIVQRR